MTYTDLIDNLRKLLESPRVKHLGDRSRGEPNKGRALDESLSRYIVSLEKQTRTLGSAALVAFYSSLLFLCACVGLLVSGQKAEFTGTAVIISLVLQIARALVTRKEEQLRGYLSAAEEYMSSLNTVDVLMDFSESIHDQSQKDKAKAKLLRDLPKLLLEHMPRWMG